MDNNISLQGMDQTVTAEAIKELRKSVEGSSTCDQCVALVTWIIKAAAPLGCVAGEIALNGLFIAADIIFAIGDEILIPLEAVVDVAFGVACAEVGAATLEKNAREYALAMCKTAKIC